LPTSNALFVAEMLNRSCWRPLLDVFFHTKWYRVLNGATCNNVW